MAACKAGALNLTGADAELFATWMDKGTDLRGRRVSAELLRNVLAVAGHNVGPTTLKVHRLGRCPCNREE